MKLLITAFSDGKLLTHFSFQCTFVFLPCFRLIKDFSPISSRAINMMKRLEAWVCVCSGGEGGGGRERGSGGFEERERERERETREGLT